MPMAFVPRSLSGPGEVAEVPKSAWPELGAKKDGTASVGTHRW